MNQAVKGWQALDDEPRQAWISLATQRTYPNRLGQKRSITGYQLYLKVNILRALQLLAPMTVAPGTSPPLQIAEMTVSASITGGILVTPDAPTAPGPRPALIYGAMRFSSDLRPFFRNFRYLSTEDFTKGATKVITTEFEARFGIRRALTVIAIRLVPFVDDYPPGTPIQNRDLVTL